MKQRLRREVTRFGIYLKKSFVECIETQKMGLAIAGVCLMGFDSFVHSILKSQHSFSSFGFGVFLAVVMLPMVKTWRFRHRKKRIPRNARFLILLLMPNATGDALLGCLEEGFHKIANDKTQGPARARFWYWFQVLISLRPLAWAFVKRISGLAAAHEAIRRFTK